jgi:hypothetical protein
LRTNNPKGFIRYQIRSDKNEPNEYATYCPKCHGHPNPDKVVEKDIWLGKVLDKDKGVFYTRKEGVRGFNIDDGFFSLTPSDIEIYNQLVKKNSLKEDKTDLKKSFSIEFGDIAVVNHILANTSLAKIFKSVAGDELETLNTLITYRLLYKKPNKYLYNWWNETYTRYIYPNAKVKHQQISNFLTNLGDDRNFKKFFIEHINFIKSLSHNSFILIDSIGLTNDFGFPIIAINNHNSVINNEIRLIFVIEANTGYPIYYRYVTGNIVDESILNMVINELADFNIKIDKSIANLKITQILPYYNFKQSIEQIFDYLKFEADIIPTKIHSEMTFSGHLLLSFMSLTTFIYLKNALSESKQSIQESLDSLHRYHCRVYANKLVPDVTNKIVNNILNYLKINIKRSISIN